MIVYHGSSHNFHTLRLCPKYTGQSTRENEGVGIYFSTNRSVAESYGKYIYTLEINDDVLIDFRKKSEARKYVSAMLTNIRKKTKVPVQNYLGASSLADYIVNGTVCIANLGEREINLLLDSTERWYTDGITETQRQNVYRALRQEDKKLKAYMFPYHIRDIGVIKDVSPEVVKIMGKEKVSC
ncbi:MAG: hypothetical protein MR218_08465 [Eubacterium sp.]|nr:hypothetical protein [Eubacterium sp.]